MTKVYPKCNVFLTLALCILKLKLFCYGPRCGEQHYAPLRAATIGRMLWKILGEFTVLNGITPRTSETLTLLLPIRCGFWRELSAPTEIDRDAS